MIRSRPPALRGVAVVRTAAGTRRISRHTQMTSTRPGRAITRVTMTTATRRLGGRTALTVSGGMTTTRRVPATRGRP